MELSTLVSYLEVVTESGSLTLCYYQCFNSQIPRTLYLGHITKNCEMNLEIDYQKYLLCSLFVPQCQNSQLSSKFLENLYSNDMMAQLYDETAENIFLIFFCNVPFVNQFLLIKFDPVEVWNNSSQLSNQIQLMMQNRIKDIQYRNEFYKFYENQVKYLKELIESSVSNYYEIQKRESELENLKLEREKSSDPKKHEKNEANIRKCSLCKQNQINIAFIPCGHAISCRACTVNLLCLEVNKTLEGKKCQHQCTVCKKQIKLAKELFF